MHHRQRGHRRHEEAGLLEERSAIETLGRRVLELQKLVERLARADAHLAGFATHLRVMMHNLEGDGIAEVSRDAAHAFTPDHPLLQAIINNLEEQPARASRRLLNEIEGLANPTAENIALWIWQRTKPALPQLARVRVYETADCWADYDGD